MPKARPYWIKHVEYIEGKKKAESRVEALAEKGINARIYPGIDPKCRVNHDQPGFGGHIDQVCPSCKGYMYV